MVLVAFVSVGGVDGVCWGDTVADMAEEDQEAVVVASESLEPEARLRRQQPALHFVAVCFPRAITHWVLAATGRL